MDNCCAYIHILSAAGVKATILTPEEYEIKESLYKECIRRGLAKTSPTFMLLEDRLKKVWLPKSPCIKKGAVFDSTPTLNVLVPKDFMIQNALYTQPFGPCLWPKERHVVSLGHIDDTGNWCRHESFKKDSLLARPTERIVAPHCIAYVYSLGKKVITAYLSEGKDGKKDITIVCSDMVIKIEVKDEPSGYHYDNICQEFLNLNQNSPSGRDVSDADYFVFVSHNRRGKVINKVWKV